MSLHQHQAKVANSDRDAAVLHTESPSAWWRFASTPFARAATLVKREPRHASKRDDERLDSRRSASRSSCTDATEHEEPKGPHLQSGTSGTLVPQTQQKIASDSKWLPHSHTLWTSSTKKVTVYAA